MNKLLFTLKRSFWIVIIFLLASCGPAITAATPGLDVKAIYTQTAATVMAQITQTTSDRPTATIIPSFSPPKTLVPTALPLFPLDGYVMIFTKDDDLYFQDGNNSPVQLTHGEEKTDSHLISDDNKKIVFSRGRPLDRSSFSNIYSVNSDGSQMQALITSRWLAELGEGTKVRYPIFVPGTHGLLFNTYLCQSKERYPSCFVGIFSVDTDTGEIKRLLAPGFAGQADVASGNFQVSPDGEMISVARIGHIELLNMDGQVVNNGIMTYTMSIPSYNFVRRFSKQFWLPDSSGLIVALPDTTNNIAAYGIVPAYSVWRYTINSNTAVQIRLDPSPMILAGCDQFQVSPDGNFILYGGNGEYASSLYLGNLGNGQTQLYDSQVYPCFSWGSDSKHFLYGNSLGTIDKPPVSKNAFHLGKWIDVNHFTYFDSLKNNTEIRIFMAEIRGETIFSYALGLSPANLVIIRLAAWGMALPSSEPRQ